jgi:hypothetical protein
VGALAVLATLSSCDSGAPTALYELSGIITEVNGGPIGGARVVFRADTLETADTYTNGDGVYRLSIESQSRFGQVRAEADGYIPGESTVFFDTNVRRLDLILRPGRGGDG